MHKFLLQHLLVDSAIKYPNSIAVDDGEISLTYSELNSKSNLLAFGLKELGIKEGDRIAFMLEKSIESVISIFGILKTGASYVPIDTQSPYERVKHVIENCKIQILIVSGSIINTEFQFALGKSLKNVVVVGESFKTQSSRHKVEFMTFEEVLNQGTDENPRVGISNINPAYILHTSGSTGLPKGVVLSHLNAMSFVEMITDFFQIKKVDRICSIAPFHFDLSIFDIFGAVRVGASIYLVPEKLSIFPAKVAKFIEEKEITIWNSVASTLSLLAERGRVDSLKIDRLRVVIFSGDILPLKYLRKLKNNMPMAEFYNLYGQTEANSSTFFHVKEMPDSETWKVPIGKPLPNFEVYALDENGNSIKNPGEVGELYVCGSTLALGYWGDEKRTSDVFIDTFESSLHQKRTYKTGDLVELDDKGNYVFVGRKDQQIKSRGYRIQINEIEYLLKNNPKVKEAVVIAIPDEIIGNRIISFLIPDNEKKLSEIEVYEYLSKFLPRYMLPEKIHFLQLLPKTSTGKCDKKLLMDRILTGGIGYV